MRQVEKVYIIVRADLSPSYQAVQSSHALTDLVFQNIKDMLTWHRNSNTIVLLSVPNERALLDVEDQLKDAGMRFASFREPDIQNELTAIALLPCEDAKQFCKQFKLAKLCSCSLGVQAAVSKTADMGSNPIGGANEVN